MGIETALALGVGSSLIGGALQYGENKAARKRATQVTDQASAIAEQPLGSATSIQQALNPGQDSFLQYLRSNPTALKPFQFDASQAFKDLQANDTQQITNQLDALSAGAGSLGARFGSGFAAKEALARSNFAAQIGARNAGIAQNSFNTALNAGMADFQSGVSNRTALLQLLQQGQLAQRGQQLQALGLGVQVPGTGAGQIISSTGGGIAQLLTLMNYMNKSGTGAGASGSGATNLQPSSIIYMPPVGVQG